jgi:hypothetical protein
MNVEIRTEAVQFPEKEFINGIFLEVWVGGGGEGERWNSPATQHFSTAASREMFNNNDLLLILLL